MSVCNLSSAGKNLSRLSLGQVINGIRNLSRRSNSTEGPFKVVKSRKSSREQQNEGSLVSRDPNFEILASPGGFPFFLPGNVSPAWYDINTTVQTDQKLIMKQTDLGNTDANIVCRVQECPAVLRQTVCDLFPNKKLESSELSVITISMKVNPKLLRRSKELETEKLAQTFLLTAKNICDKLRVAGYWADFINPFSGKPYLYPQSTDNSLYETDEKFRCLDFQIFEINKCKIISNESEDSANRFVGSLFTNAPSNKNHLDMIFSK